MHTPTDRFLTILALAELRRHMPGVSQHLESNDNPSGIPFKDAFFTIFLRQPPTIKVRVRDLLQDGYQERIANRAGDERNMFEVVSYAGGMTSRAAGYVDVFPPKIQLFALGDTFAGDAVDKPSLLYRKPARYENSKGKNLGFILDEVDRHVMDARMHFRRPDPGDSESPKTIYDYIEAKVVDDPDVLAWVGYERST